MIFQKEDHWDSPNTEDTVHLDTGPAGPWAKADLKDSSLRIGFHAARRCHESIQRRETTKSSTLLWNGWSIAMTSIAY